MFPGRLFNLSQFETSLWQSREQQSNLAAGAFFFKYQNEYICQHTHTNQDAYKKRLDTQ